MARYGTAWAVTIHPTIKNVTRQQFCKSWDDELNLNCKLLISLSAKVRQTNSECRTFAKLITVVCNCIEISNKNKKHQFYRSHFTHSKSSFVGSLGKGACGSRWYQKETEAISDFWG